MKKIVKNGIFVTAADTFQGDILIEDGVIAAIGAKLEVPNAELIDASGCYVFPGGIDPHTHLDMPFGGTVTRDDSSRARSRPLTAVRRRLLTSV